KASQHKEIFNLHKGFLCLNRRRAETFKVQSESEMDVPKDQMSTLLDCGLYNSAQMLGCFLVSSSSVNNDTSPHLKAENLALYGDALLQDKEYRRAIHVYKQALQYHKIISKVNATTRSSLSTSNRSSSPNSFNASAINENEVKFKIASCHCAINENRAALAEMEAIPSKARNLQMNLLMGKLYRCSKHTRPAIACYKECLRHCPYIIEAITALAELGVQAKDIFSLLPQTPNRSGRPPFDQFESSRWLQRYVEAQCCIASNDYKGGLELFSELLQRFPNNVHILLEMAKEVIYGIYLISSLIDSLFEFKVEAIIGKNDEAITDFEKVRSIDPYVVTYMDEYAMLLKLKSDPLKLNKLVHDLLSIDPARPEVFVALSVLWERKDDRAALTNAEKSIRIDDRHITGHIVKKQLWVPSGLVRSYLALLKTKEALYAAREAMKAMPQSAKALKLVGDVYASNSSGREKAKKFYESALRLEPGYLGAALALAELHVMEARNYEAVTLLERYLKDWADDSLHVKLAQGVDPDAPEEEEENDADDADGDPEETELL
ncbi:Tetratricopeptide-like helical, partial [Cynara cardunculus var. scolymus]